VLCIGDSGTFSSGIVDAVVGKNGGHIISAAKLYSTIKDILTKNIEDSCKFEKLTYIYQTQSKKEESEIDYYYAFEVPYSMDHKEEISDGKEKTVIKKHKYPLRLIFIKSDGKKRRDIKRREKLIKNLKDKLEDIKFKLNKVRNKKESTVNEKIIKALGNDEGRYVKSRLYGDDGGLLQLEWSLDEKSYWEKEGLCDGIYALITSLPKEGCDKSLPSSLDEIFNSYKRQTFIEMSHKTMKLPLRVRPIYLLM